MEREKFKEDAKQFIDKIFARIDELEAKKDRVTEDKKQEYEEMLASLRQRKKLLLDKYNNLSSSAEDKWEEARITFSDASESFKDGFDKIASLFR